MKFINEPLLEIAEYSDVIKTIREKGFPFSISGPSDSQKVHLACSVCQNSGYKGVYITYNEMTARKAYEDFSFFLGEDVVFLPNKELMLHDVEARSNDAVFDRLKAIERITKGSYKVVVTSAEAIAHKIISKEKFIENILEFKMGGRIDVERTTLLLVSAGYERVEIVEGRGQFAVRGGIIDIFPVSSESAVRIELFDDEIDSMRAFDTSTQRSTGNIESFMVIPAREVVYHPGDIEDIVLRIRKDLEKYLKETGGKTGAEHVKKIKDRVGADIERIKSDHYFPGIDRLIPYLIEKPSLILDYIDSQDSGNIVFLDESARFGQRMDNLLLEHNETCKSFLERGQLLPGSFELLHGPEFLKEKLSGCSLISLSTMPAEGQKLREGKIFSIPSKAMHSYQGHIELLEEDLKYWKMKGSRTVIFSGSRGRGERLADSLGSRGISAAYVHDFQGELAQGQILITHGSLNKGFEYPSIGLVIVSDKEAFGQDRKRKRVSGKKEGSKIKAFTDLSIGDFVVHQAHGIGQYVGIQKLVVDNVKRDYLKIRYQDGDFLYIPTGQLDLIQKFIGSEGKSPKMSRLGGTDWARTKSRVKESLRELAGELVRLYAQREALQGFAFAEDTVWQNQFEETFPYEETDDQLKCIEEIKADMESIKPMDRLLCGDVGYGKTEVALRALFKATMSGKQVAYLVPTTVLAQQHYMNFKKRLQDFPVKVEVMSRFRTQTEQKHILKDLKSGNVDILVGTHRLIQKDIQFKDLGLLIVDEEQRFGVAHKEKLKNIKPNVDVLTLTATPIPRTLHMSLVGIRDISVIEDPPEERYPVQTYVMEYNAEVISDALIRELGRKGQVFYLYNRVRSIQLKAAELKALVPEARIAVAHGQMNENELEDVMADFINGEYDILVCTTIIESGLDMPNVNTIIVEDADRMGLAQLYQLRGRVGRSNRLAYAYITYKRDKILSEIAEKRLQAIKEFTEFGSGFKIAMRDLEIRGAGNLLGPEQHGHMDSVGYDMYCRLLNEAVRELKGEQASEDELEMTIDISVSAYIDDDYIGIENQKIEMYKKIASIQDEQDVTDIQDELVDRYGDPPEPVVNLIQIAYVKALAKECGFVSVQEKNGAVLFQYRNNSCVNLQVLSGLMEKYRKKLLFTASSTPYLTYKVAVQEKEKLLYNIKFLLQDIKKLK